MEGVAPRSDVTFESVAVGGVPGLWVHPASSRSDEALLHLHGGWFHAGNAAAYRHLVGHIAARAGTRAFVPDYRLAPEHPFPAAVDDVRATYRGMDESGIRRIALTGDSAGGNLALVLVAYLVTRAVPAKAGVVGVAAFSPVTDLTLSGATYETRAEADPYFTKQQVAALVHSYLGSADPNDPLASPLQGRLFGLPPIRIHVGDDEVLLDDSRRYVERALAEGSMRGSRCGPACPMDLSPASEPSRRPSRRWMRAAGFSLRSCRPVTSSEKGHRSCQHSRQ